MKVRQLGAVVAAGALLLAGVTATQPAEAATSKLQITKVYVNAPGTDRATNTSVNGEYVKIKNKSRKSMNLTGYTVRDESNHVYTFGSFTLKRGKTVTVYSGKGTNTSTKRYMGQGWHVWNNSGGDSATLRNASGAKLDGCGWKKDIASSVKC